MNNNVAINGIAITLHTEQDLNALGDAFLGKTSGVDPHLVSDDYLVAVLLGWHMRSSALKSTKTNGYVFTEFAFRRTLAADKSFTDHNSEIRAQSLGEPSTPGNVLTIDGIDGQTNNQIRTRIATLEQRFKELELQAIKDADSETDNSTWSFVAGFSDQEIIDIGTWAVIQSCIPENAAVETYPTGFENEIDRRGRDLAKSVSGLK